MIAFLLHPEEGASPIEPGNGENFTLPEVRSYVGGFVAVTSLQDGFVLLCNEDAAFNPEGNPPNPHANLAAGSLGFKGAQFLGTVVICHHGLF